ncbi:MAG: hydroxymyristoyl-ACP dehydratase [Proteobacteria bacterium]|jgi:predicted hotdog family 3-hydroxylacyl-ACP dehydratase|nr:hydroxymyristoyl-ACP dehydratase [Pseudomonadota bacterium]
MMRKPAPLDRAGIEARIPHHGAMCLLHELVACDARELRCRVVSHADAAHPLRSHGALPAVAGIELASQAMALHGALNAPALAPPRAGFLASARSVRLHVARLDDAPGPLVVHVVHLAGDATQALYAFDLSDAAARLLVEGRLAVVLDAGALK